MRRLRAWLLRLAGTFSGTRRERDLADELDGHIQLHIADNIRAGMTPAEAGRRAILALGGIEQVKETYRERQGLPTFTHLIQDTRYGLRTRSLSGSDSTPFTVTVTVKSPLFFGSSCGLLKSLAFTFIVLMVVVFSAPPPTNSAKSLPVPLIFQV